MPGRTEEGEFPKLYSMDTLINAAREPDMFGRVMARWLERDETWDLARTRFFTGWNKQRLYDSDRMVGAANMFEALPQESMPPKTPLSPDFAMVIEQSKELFRGLPGSRGKRQHAHELGPSRFPTPQRQNPLSFSPHHGGNRKSVTGNGICDRCRGGSSQLLCSREHVRPEAEPNEVGHFSYQHPGVHILRFRPNRVGMGTCFVVSSETDDQASIRLVLGLLSAEPSELEIGKETLTHCCPTNFRYPGGGVGVAGEPGAAGRGGKGAGGGRRG